MNKLIQLFIAKTSAANEAKTEMERLLALAERTGIRDSIEALYGQGAVGEAIMAADHHYLDLGYHGDMTGGVWLDWKPEPQQVRCHCDNGRWETECCSGAGGCS